MKQLILPVLMLTLFGFGCIGTRSVQTPAMRSGTYPKPAPMTETVDDFINGDTVSVYEQGALVSLRSAQGNIYVKSPLPGDEVKDAFSITGEARVFENTLNYRIKDVSGAILVAGYTMASAPDIGTFGAYTINIDASTWQAQPLTVEVYWASAKDGSDTDVVSYIVKLL